MKKQRWLARLKEKWRLKSNWQVAIVLVVFACTGFTVLLIKRPVLGLLTPEFKDHWFFSVLYFVFILPLYNIILLFYGFVFGQFSFFWEFEKRSFKRIADRFRRQKSK